MADDAARVLGKRVAALRQQRAFTLEQLAAASGVSRSMLSQIERGQANPTLAVTFRIARAFAMTVGELVDDASVAGAIEVVHGADPGNLFRADGRCSIRTLSPLYMENRVEFYELRIEAGEQLDSAAHYDGTRELFTVTAGRALVEAAGTRCELAVGDTAHYRADTRHRIVNPAPEILVGFLVVTNR